MREGVDKATDDIFDALKEMTRSASKPVARTYSYKHMGVCDISLHHGDTETCKTLEKYFIFQIGALNSVNPHGIYESFSFDYFIVVFHAAMLPPIA